ncbi:MAG: pyridoxamine 5'-phosphate oxidase family protein, partial [Bacteroidota bacterium]|nr:pyridoxamine 5'-phosphate oxidase family protein [Bacteroidota bacterium]
MHDKISHIRKDYSHQTLLEKDVDPNPVNQFTKWWQEALHAEIVEPNAMNLATASLDAMPSARIVLLKAFNKKGFVFFTNYQSFKAQQLV